MLDGHACGDLTKKNSAQMTLFPARSRNTGRRYSVMTHLLKSVLNRKLLALVVFTATLTPQALKAGDADALCPLGNATLRGTYMLRGEGTIVGVGPATVVGWLTYDGK